MGSSNISDSGMGISSAPRYELNVAMKGYDDVSYCYDEFCKLWEEAVPLTADDIESYKKVESENPKCIAFLYIFTHLLCNYFDQIVKILSHIR